MSIKKCSNKIPLTKGSFFTGDTLVALADGRGYLSFKQLSEEKEDINVYSESNNKVITIRTIKPPVLREISKRVFKIIFTSGESIRVTENQSLYLHNNELVEFSELKKGQQLRVVSKYKNSRCSGILNRDSRLFGDLPNFTISSIKEEGFEDIYSISVDLYSNYFIGNFKGKVGSHNRLGTSIKVFGNE